MIVLLIVLCFVNASGSVTFYSQQVIDNRNVNVSSAGELIILRPAVPVEVQETDADVADKENDVENIQVDEQPEERQEI